MATRRFSKNLMKRIMRLKESNARMVSEKISILQGGGVGVSEGHINRILTGKTPNAGIVTLSQIADALGVQVTDFCETDHPWQRADYGQGTRIIHEILDSPSNVPLVTVTHTLLGHIIPGEMKLAIKESILRRAGLKDADIAPRLELVRAGIPFWEKKREEGEHVHRILAPESALTEIAKVHPEWVEQIIKAVTRWIDATSIAFMKPKPWEAFERQLAEWTTFPNWDDVYVKGDGTVHVYSGCELHGTANPNVAGKIVQIIDYVSLDAVRYFPERKKMTPHDLVVCNQLSLDFMKKLIGA